MVWEWGLKGKDFDKEADHSLDRMQGRGCRAKGVRCGA